MSLTKTLPDAADGDQAVVDDAGTTKAADHVVQKAAKLAKKMVGKKKQAERAQETEENKKKIEKLTELHSAGQLALWGDAERGMPNELVRCALFSARNKTEKRESFQAASPLVVDIIGGGKIIYIGEELRQQDETVWMQLVHLAKVARSEVVTFTAHSFLKSLGWPHNGGSYTRLLASIRRLSAGSIEVYSSRFDRGVSTKLVAKYEYSKGADTPWVVRVFDKEDKLLFLFDTLYSRIDWDMRLALPDGVATWLHGFFSSHKEPFGHRIETLVLGAGLALDAKDDEAELTDAQKLSKRRARLREAKRTIIRALEGLKAVGFLSDYHVSSKGIVNVRRVGDTRPIT